VVLTKRFRLDVQRLLVDAGAVKANDHRLLRSGEVEGDDVYSSIRSSRAEDPEDADNDDDWN